MSPLALSPRAQDMYRALGHRSGGPGGHEGLTGFKALE